MKSDKQRILCIDNNASSNLAVYLLEQAGYEVRTASSIAEGIEVANSEHFDVHLLNHKLLEGDMIEVCDKLDQHTPRTPIVFYSTVFYPYEEIGPIDCRLHGHLIKPVSSGDVVANVFKLAKKPTEVTNQNVAPSNREEPVAVLRSEVKVNQNGLVLSN